MAINNFNNKASKAGSTDGEEGGFLDMIADGKSALDNFQAKMASVMPSIPGQPAGKFQDISIGIDFHPTMFPPSPLLPVPHVGMVFDILGAIFAAINAVVPPPPEPEYAEDGEPVPQPISVSSVAVSIVQAMAPSVMVNNKFIANAGISIQHLPGVVLHALPSVAPMASSEMFMGSSTVMADGAPFSYQFLPALSCNLVGMPAPFRVKKPKAKVSLMAPTAALINVIPGGMPVLVGGPPTIDLFAMAVGLAFKGMGKLFKKGGDKLQKYIDNILPKNPAKAKRLQKVKCKLFGEPVDAATGRVFAENDDFTLPGPIPITWTRYYHSDGEIASPIGTNWHHSYHMGYWEMENGFITLLLADSREIVLPALHEGDSFYHRKERITWFKDEQGKYAYTDANGLTYKFLSNRIDNDLFPIHKIENELQHTITFQYNKGILSEIIDSAGRTLTISSKDGRITEVFTKNENKKVSLIQYEVDVNDNLTKVTDAKGVAKIFQYKKHLLVQLTNQSGLNFYWEYEGEGANAKCIHTWGDQGILEYWTQYQKGKTIATNSLGHSTTYYYDEDNLIYRITDARGGETYQKYNSTQDLMLVTDPVGNTVKYEYDRRGNLVLLQDANGGKTILEYDEKDRLIASRSPMGATARWIYNEEGKLVERTYPDGTKTTYNYTGNEISSITNDLDQETQLSWNQQGELERINLHDGRWAVWYYNDLGQLQKHIDVKGSTTEYTYDVLGNVTQLKEADNIHDFTYDPSGNITRAYDKDRDVSFTYWGLGNLKSRTENKKTIYFNYDTEEQLTGIVNEHGEAYRFSLDPLGQIASEWGFDGLQRRYIRDRAGRVIKVLRPDERYTSYMYDGVGNILAADHYDGTGEYFAYDTDGKLVEATNAEATVTYAYDSKGRLIEENQNGHTVQSKYNRQGNRTAITSSLGANITHAFNSNGQLTRIEALNNLTKNKDTIALNGKEPVSSGVETWGATFERDDLGLELRRMVQSQGTTLLDMRTERDKKGRVTQQNIQAKNVEGGKTTQSRSMQYQWASGDRLRSTIDQLTGKTVNYSYDTAGSLLAASYKGNTETIYKMPDAVGNLFKTKGRKDRTYGKGGQLLKDEKTTYTYDAEGNLSHKQTLKGTETYKYYGNGMLKSIAKPNGKEISFEYDALGRRTAKIYNQKITRFVYDGNVLLHEWEYTLEDRPKLSVNAKGFVVSDAVEPVDTDKLVSWVFDYNSFVPAAKIVDGNTYSIACDHLGTPVQAYNQTGEKVWDCTLDIYGKIKTLEGEKCFIPFRYQGQYEDSETGLYYNRFRYYSADSGTYISQDPIKLSGGDNLYAYTRNSNVLIDPLGLTPLGQEGFSVYGLFEAGAKEPYYIGISYDTNRRLGEHIDTGRADMNTSMKVFNDTDLTYAQARGQEQHLIEKHGTKTGTIGQEIGPNNKGNKVNSFDTTRTDTRGKAFKSEYDKAKATDKPKIKCG
ncbi:RHS repeat-associated core domain-containing protein [uncultured Maribacter sp.]|uniref:RHS repeat-associated core domain-containing protein n=1 Tax=uncultured Maribacter sp. TaxID=431308 RepID=UPI00261710E0|nr:RHS repeat-associated core domain-containing protein [uncultured Maribacter sp.]